MLHDIKSSVPNMENDDDAILIIVGDENDENIYPSSSQTCLSSSSIENQKILNETDSTPRTLDHHENTENTAIINEVILDDTDEDCHEEFLSDWQRLRHRKLKRKRCRRSFVQELRERHPELAGDNDLLISTLAEIMKSSKPPPAPPDHFVMNGVLFECIVCSALYARKPDVSCHYRDIHGPKYLFCFNCGLKFRRSSYLYEHEKRCHGPDTDLVLQARAIAVGNKGRRRPFLKEAKTFRQLHFSETDQSQLPKKKKKKKKKKVE